MAPDAFDERRNAAETAAVRKDEFDFRVNARASRLFGLWAAEKMNLTGDDAQDYAATVVEADLEEPGIQDVIRKVAEDFAARGVDGVTTHHLENRFRQCQEEARRMLS